MKSIEFILNGKNVQTQVQEGETVLDVLRNHFDLTGAKKGCEVGECGACTILIDGIPLNSCMILAVQVNGKELLTIEGLSDGFDLHPIQQAFIDEGGVQCGYCTPGMILASYALIKQYENPTAEQIKTGLAGNLCRCAAYPQIINAVQAASKKMATVSKLEP